MNLPARYLNHSCSPNVGVLGLNANGSYNFAALKDIGCKEVCMSSNQQTPVLTHFFNLPIGTEIRLWNYWVRNRRIHSMFLWFTKLP
jgi:hypothetical protein